MRNWLREKIRRWLGVDIIEARYARMADRALDAVETVKQHARLDADVGFRGNNTIVLTGIYRKRAFVRFYDLGDGEFEALVDQLRQMKETALIRHVDAPPQFHGTFEL